MNGFFSIYVSLALASPNPFAVYQYIAKSSIATNNLFQLLGLGRWGWLWMELLLGELQNEVK